MLAPGPGLQPTTMIHTTSETSPKRRRPFAGACFAVIAAACFAVIAAATYHAATLVM
jgi:hypothetical protein